MCVIRWVCCYFQCYGHGWVTYKSVHCIQCTQWTNCRVMPLCTRQNVRQMEQFRWNISTKCALNGWSMQARFYVGACGNCRQTSALSPKCDMKHCLANSKLTWDPHIDVKRSVPWPSKYAKMCFPAGAPPRTTLGSSWPFTDPLVGWGGDTFPYPTPLGAFD